MNIEKMLDEGSVQMASMTFDIFKNKGKVEAMSNESLNHLNLIQQLQYAFNKLSTFLLHFQQC